MKFNKTFKTSGIILMFLIIVISCLKLINRVSAENQYCTSIEECFVDAGRGTDDDPYRISTTEQLNAIRYDLNASYLIVDDIDLTYDTQNENGKFYNNGLGWEPIPFEFNGVLDGNNHKIKGLFVLSETKSDPATFIISNDGIIKNLTFYDGRLVDKKLAMASGVVEHNNGTIMNVYNYNDVYSSVFATGIVRFNSGKIDSSYNFGHIYGEQGAAGIAGTNGGVTIVGPNGSYSIPAEITNCFNAGTIVSTGISEAGGIVENNRGYIENVYNYGKISGGSGIAATFTIEKETNSVIKNAYNIGEVSEYAIVSNIENATLENVYYLDEYESIGTSGENVTLINVEEIKIEDINSKKQLTGFNYIDDWEYVDVNERQFLVLKKFGYISRENSNFDGGSGTRFDPWLISTPQQLNNIRLNTNAYYSLINNIDLTYDTQNENGKFYNNGLGWEPIKGYYRNSFNGNFDGNGFEIIGLNINRPEEEEVGLFSRVDYALISNLIFTNGKVVGKKYVGMLAGISDAGRDETGKITNIKIYGNVDGEAVVGGLIGDTRSSLSYIENYADIFSESCSAGIAWGSKIIEYSFNVGTINGDSSGGLVGKSQKIYNSYNSGNVNGESSGGLAYSNWYGEIKNCYNTGNVNSDNENAALIYSVLASNIENVYNTGKSNKGYLFYEIRSIPSDSSTIKNVYYLNNNNYNYKTVENNIVEENFKVIDVIDLKNKNLFSNWKNLEENWEFNNVNEISRFPHLKNVNKQYIENISLNSEWEFNQLLTTNGKVKEFLTPQVIINKETDYNQNYIYLIENNEIAKYNDGKIIGLTEGTTKINKLISLYDGYTVDIDEEVNVRTIKWESVDNKLYKKDDRYYYYIGTDEINDEKILNDIKVNYDDINTIIDGKDVKIYQDNDYLVGKISILSMSSRFHDLTKDYLYFKNSCKTLHEIFSYGPEIAKSSDLYYDISPRIDFNLSNTKVCDINTLSFTAGYMGEVVKTFDIVNFKSDKYDLTKDYIFDYEENDITINNGTLNKNIENNTLEIKYGEDVLETYKLVEVNSEEYDLSNSIIKVKDNTINKFIEKLNCINCEVKIYDGENYLTEGEFADNSVLRIMYGEDVLKEYNLTFPVSSITLNKESVTLGLEKKNTVQLEATINPKNAENKNVSWTSSNEDIATVDSNGLVTSVGLGKTTITATTEDGGFTDTVEIEVVNIITYTLTYQDENTTYEEEYEEDEEVTLKSDITKAGYDLKGWQFNDTEYKLTDKFVMPAEDVILQAIWELIIPDIEETSNYKIKEKFINKIPIGTNITNFNLGLSNIYQTNILNKDNELKTEGIFVTGDKVKIMLGEEEVTEYTVIIKGDIRGTGTSTVSDVAKLYQFLKGKITMEDCYKEAGNVVSTDNEIKINDVAKLYQFIKKKISSLED